ncbi:hypothetical protein DOTSEDRAFT_178384 [Dothistroma septosporum NZE10]|uniref:Multicopper oxidase-like protein n=1 Tax=Dothistroma septosporum (strain NZE10 / CBS 128990) TaxID=675120 RepID=N1PF82_DOTSN|nr:hypothetical protein DOTSEDRAFT_178384 [Dothistroma septosporum NZE10]
MQSEKARPKSGLRSKTTIFALITTIFITTFLISGLGLNLGSWYPSFLAGDDRWHADEHGCSWLRPEEHAFRNTTTREYHWRVTSGLRRPDGVLKRVYLVNDAFPGPTIEARSGDRILVHVQNGLENAGVSIHWHGLQMRGANRMDGAAGITQASIEPGHTFTYDFITGADESGTFWWHAHDGVQRADGLYGGFVVHKPSHQGVSQQPDAEHLLLVGDWYHRSAEDALEYYMHPGAFGLETVPDSVLVNGLGSYTCSDAVPARPVDCIASELAANSLDLATDRHNILRIVNVGAYAGFSISLSDRLLRPIRVDAGHQVSAAASKSVGVLHPGERMDVLVLRQKSKSRPATELTVRLDDGPFKYENMALALSHNFSVKWRGSAEPHSIHDDATYESFDIQTIKSAHDQASLLPITADRVIVLYTLTQKLAHLDNEPRGFINHSTWAKLYVPLVDLSRTHWDKDIFVPQIKHDAESPLWIDIVLNDLDEDSHPFHLHGHVFWVLSSFSSTFNWGSYNPYEDLEPPAGEYKISTAVKKDTFYVPRRGYAVLRFRADNPGLWLFHCHVLWHQASGMAMAFDIR